LTEGSPRRAERLAARAPVSGKLGHVRDRKTVDRRHKPTGHHRRRTMSRIPRRSLVARAGLLGALVLAVTGVAGAASKTGKTEHGTVHFAITHTIGSTNVAAGDTTDSLFGAGAVVYRLHVLTNTTGKITIKVPKVTVFYSTGSATGSATSTLTITNSPHSGDATVTGGILKLTKGTGTHKGHSFAGTFSGTGNITSGLYTINYKGTYK
jgi:hypothetical protein